MESGTSRMLCPSCDAVFDTSNSDDGSRCPSCDHSSCSFAIHINEGTRKMWMDIENGPRWKRNKKIHRSLFHELRKDSELTEDINRMVDGMFRMFREIDLDELFPKYREDYARTTGKKSLLHARKERPTFSTRRQRKSKKRTTKTSKFSKKDKLRKKNKTSQNVVLSVVHFTRGPSKRSSIALQTRQGVLRQLNLHEGNAADQMGGMIFTGCSTFRLNSKPLDQGCFKSIT